MHSFRSLHSFVLLVFVAAVDAWTCECGFYCPDPVLKYKAPVLCPVGSYCTLGQFNKTSYPRNCTAGRQCPTAGLCAPLGCPCGTYCPQGSSQPIPCTKGHFCPANASKQTLCNINDCPADNMCSKLQKTTTAACPQPLPCDPLNPPPGFYCSNDPSVGCGLICIDDAGCPGTSLPPNPPTTGTVTNQVKKTTTSAPPVFTCGYFVPPLGISEVPCPPGFYCPSGPSPSTPIVPVKCPGGYVCAGLGTCNPVPCPCGFKCPEGSAEQIECQPPYYCPHALATSQTVCPIGFKCDKPGLCNATACPPGTHVTCAGKRTCDPCDKGRYCPNATTSTLCPKGYYCPLGSSAPTLCPAKAYCPLGSEEPKWCPTGTSSPPGSDSKSQCTARRQLLELLATGAGAARPGAD